MSAPSLRCMATIKPEEIRWLWKGRIALGKVTLLVGNPDVGKSLLSLDIVARASRGATWSDGAVAMEGPVSAILLSAEDDAGDIQVPRLVAAGADLELVHVMDCILELEDGRVVERWPSIGKDLEAIRAAIKGRPGTRLVVIDPLSAYLGRTDSHRDAEVRQVLGPLAALAAELHVAVVVILHCNKSTLQTAIHRVGGSIAFVAAARSVWLVARDPNDEERHMLVPIKNNIVRRGGGGLAFRIVGVQVCDLLDLVPKLDWEVEPVTQTADEILNGAEANGDQEGAQARAEVWLRERLRDGPVEARTVYAEAQLEGISRRTLERAKTRLRVRSRPPSEKGGRWTWELPAPEEPSPTSSPPPSPGEVGDLGDLAASPPGPDRADRQLRQDRQGCQGPPVATLQGADRADFEERAAIMEFEGGLPRAEAERRAMEALVVS